MAEAFAPTVISQEDDPAWRFTAPSVTFHIRHPTGIVPLDGSAVTAAGLIWIYVPGVPAVVQTNSPPRARRQNSFRTRAPEVAGLPFWPDERRFNSWAKTA